ncbi:MAG: glutamate--tRNA ligase [Candidatus Walczuchella monophlebidarum]
MKKMRVRFAPSPTGPLHLGSLRTALYNYLLAKKHKGDFILRIEDTDQDRIVPGSEDYIIEALNWCGLTPNESPSNFGNYGPYRQSERKPLYDVYIRQLIDKGHAYYAFDALERINTLREKIKNKGEVFSYNEKTRLQMDNSLSLTSQELSHRLQQGHLYVIRFKTNTINECFILHDEVRGKLKINTKTLEDKILVKSDGMPTYHLANVIDDHLMKITHVIRGEEWLSSLPLHILLYKALGWEIPCFAHLPLILKPEGQGKLSKRDGERLGFPVFPLNWKDRLGCREKGYFPEAFINIIALLGWNPGGEQEIFSLDELIDKFSLQRVSKSGARFDKEKAKWINQQYLRKKPIEELISLFHKELEKHKIIYKDESLRKIIEAVKERAHFLSEIWDHSYYFFESPNQYDVKSIKKVEPLKNIFLLKKITQPLSKWHNFYASTLKKTFEDFIQKKQLCFSKMMQQMRLALVGTLQGPDIFFLMEMIGKEETLKRVYRFIQMFSG